MKFKGTQGEWIFDSKSKGIKNKNVKGLLATAWGVYNSEETEIRLVGESWLDMRRRTDEIREDKRIETEYNAKLISCAPELLRACIEFVKAVDNEDIILKENIDNDGHESTGNYLYQSFLKTIKKATE